MNATRESEAFDKAYWERHWAPVATGDAPSLPANPYLSAETAHLPVATALDAGCGTGSEALWLAERGWRVTGADISAIALAKAASRARSAGLDDQTEWVETDVARWEPERSWDLVVTSYAHPDTGQLAFYRHIASWVRPGGTLLIVGHLHGPDLAASDPDRVPHDHPEGTTAGLSDITDVFAGREWCIDASYEQSRVVRARGRSVRLRDVVARAHRTR